MLTMEMPDTAAEYCIPFDADSALNTVVGTAQTAADLLELGEAEGGDDENIIADGSTPSNLPSQDGIPQATETGAISSNGKPEKKKRTRKPKAEAPPADGVTATDQPGHLFDSDELTKDITLNVYEPLPQKPEPSEHDKRITEQLAKIETSRSTRSMEIARVEADCLQCFMAIAEAEGVIEEAKGVLKFQREIMAALAVELRDLRRGETWQPKLPLSDGPPAVVELTAPPPLPPVPANFYPDAWRSASVNELGLTESLANSIREGTPTIGELADRIGEINQGRAKWHKGVGAAKRTLVEDALNKWLNANRDSAQIKAECSQPADNQTAPSSGGGTPTPAQSVETQSPSSLPAAVSEIEQTDDEADAALIARAAALNNGKPNCFAPSTPTSKAWQSGYEQYGHMIEGREQEITDCPYIPGDECDDWLRGFMSARALKDFPDAVEAENVEESKPATTPQTSPIIFDSLDDI